MLTVPEIAERLNVSKVTVVRWIERGKIAAYRFGKDYRIEEEEFNRFMEQSKVDNKPE